MRKDRGGEWLLVLRLVAVLAVMVVGVRVDVCVPLGRRSLRVLRLAIFEGGHFGCSMRGEIHIMR